MTKLVNIALAFGQRGSVKTTTYSLLSQRMGMLAIIPQIFHEALFSISKSK